jgi:hypothetical protein
LDVIEQHVGKVKDGEESTEASSVGDFAGEHAETWSLSSVSSVEQDLVGDETPILKMHELD